MSSPTATAHRPTRPPSEPLPTTTTVTTTRTTTTTTTVRDCGRGCAMPSPRTRTTSPTPSTRRSSRAPAGSGPCKISLVGLGVTAVLQLIVVLASGSVALLADTIHNFSDALTAIPLWIAFVIGRRATTRRYTHGYGRAEDLAGLFVARDDRPVRRGRRLGGHRPAPRPGARHNLGWVAVAGFVGFLGNEAVAVFRIREGRAIGSAALVADGHHARTDGLTSLAVVVGAGGVALGWGWADPVVGLLITVAILLVLRTATRDVFRRLMDGIEPDLVEAARDRARRGPGGRRRR